MPVTVPSMFDGLKQAVRASLKPTINVSLLMLKVFIPLSLLTLVLKQFGVLDYLAPFFSPLMQYMGLPGEAAIALLVGFTNTIYAALATAAVLDLTARQITILGVVLGVSHALFVETGILTSLRMATVKIALFRIAVAIIAGITLNAIMPEISGTVTRQVVSADTFSPAKALLQIGIISVQIVGIIFTITFGYELTKLWKGSDKVTERMGFIPAMVGMSNRAVAPWLVGFIVGITYGAVLLYQFQEKERLSHKDACLMTVFLCLAHAVIEDTMLFVLVGGSLWWILITRIVLAVAVVRLLAMGNLYQRFLWIGLPKDHAQH